LFENVSYAEFPVAINFLGYGRARLLGDEHGKPIELEELGKKLGRCNSQNRRKDRDRIPAKCCSTQ